MSGYDSLTKFKLYKLNQLKDQMFYQQQKSPDYFYIEKTSKGFLGTTKTATEWYVIKSNNINDPRTEDEILNKPLTFVIEKATSQDKKKYPSLENYIKEYTEELKKIYSVDKLDLSTFDLTQNHTKYINEEKQKVLTQLTDDNKTQIYAKFVKNLEIPLSHGNYSGLLNAIKEETASFFEIEIGIPIEQDTSNTIETAKALQTFIKIQTSAVGGKRRSINQNRKKSKAKKISRLRTTRKYLRK